LARLDKLINKLVQFKRNVPKLVIDSIEKRQKTVFILIRGQVQKEGINGTGAKITHIYKSYPIYSEGYRKYKTKLGKYKRKIDLTLSGNYLKSMLFERIRTNKFFIGSKYETESGFDLAKHNFNVYPNHLLLTEQNQRLISKTIVQPYLKKKFNETIRI